MKRKPVVGETLYRLNIGNAARVREQKLVPVEVKKVGRKYFKCGLKSEDEWQWVEYHLDTWKQKSKYFAGYCLYETEQEYLDEVEHGQLHRVIRENFNGSNLFGNNMTLSQLRRIAAIIDEAEEVLK